MTAPTTDNRAAADQPATRIDASIIARAIAIADDAARSDIEFGFWERGRGTYELCDANSGTVRTLGEADPYLAERAQYLIDRGLAEIAIQPDDSERLVLRLERFA